MCLTTAQIILSILMLFALSVERYIKLVHPFKYAKYINRKQIFISIAFCSIYALLIASLPLMGWNNLDSSQPNKAMEICRYEIIMPGAYNMLIFGGHAGPAFIILPVLHLHIFCTAHRVLRRRSQNSANQTTCKTSHHCDKMSNGQKDSSSSLNIADVKKVPQPLERPAKKTSKFFDTFSAFRKTHHPEYMCTCHTRSYRHFKILTLAGAYFMVSWLPLAIWEWALTEGGTKNIITMDDYLYPPISVHYYYAALGLAMANSAINPLLFGIGNQTIRSAFLNTSMRMMRCRKKSFLQDDHSNNTLMLLKEHDMHRRLAKSDTPKKPQHHGAELKE